MKRRGTAAGLTYLDRSQVLAQGFLLVPQVVLVEIDDRECRLARCADLVARPDGDDRAFAS